jgi:hypothetical protein
LNNKQNTDCLIRGGKPERVGIHDSIWFDTLKLWREKGHLIERDPETGEEKPIDPADYFGFNMCGVGGWFNSLPLKDYIEVIEETDEWKITRDGAGAYS